MKPATRKLVGVYVRVSDAGQNEAGQRDVIGAWLDGQGVEPGRVRWYVDAKTGDDLNRPAFEELRRDIFAGEVGTVVVYKLDRLSRKLTDGIATLVGWLEGGLRVVSVTQQFDFSGVTGKLIAAVLFGVAEMEQETRRERQAAGIAAAKKRGVYAANAERRRGYRKAAPAEVRELRDRGLAPSKIAAALGIGRSTVYRYLDEAKAEERPEG